jgi:two-component SAPR family response regulator
VRNSCCFVKTTVWLSKQELWVQQEKHGKAAPLFVEAGLFDKAATSYHLSEKYDEAAAALRQGNHFDRLVSYLSKYVTPLLQLPKDN